MLRDTTSRGLCVRVWPPHTSERRPLRTSSFNSPRVLAVGICISVAYICRLLSANRCGEYFAPEAPHAECVKISA